MSDFWNPKVIAHEGYKLHGLNGGCSAPMLRRVLAAIAHEAVGYEFETRRIMARAKLKKGALASFLHVLKRTGRIAWVQQGVWRLIPKV